MFSALPSWTAVLLLTAAGGVLSALAAALFLTLSEARRAAAIPHLLSYATGALLGAALLGLLPEAIHGAEGVHGEAGAHRVGALFLAGILLFFLLEKLVLWRHCHDPAHEHGFGVDEDREQARSHGHGHSHGHAHGPVTDQHRARASATLVLVGDTLHNFVDGAVIAVAWLTHPGLGVATAVAVFAHEVPQEVGDLAVLLHGGYSRARALWMNTFSSLAAVAGGLVGVFALDHATTVLPDVIAVAAACLMYVAVADLIPGLHKRVDPRAALTQVVLMGLGLATVALLHPGHP